MSSENSPDGQTCHAAASARPGAARGNAKFGPAFARAAVAEQGDSQPPSCCTQGAMGEPKPSPPPPSPSSQTTHAAKKSHSCLPLPFFLFVCCFISAALTSLLARLPTAVSPQPTAAPISARHPPHYSSHLYFGYSVPDGA